MVDNATCSGGAIPLAVLTATLLSELRADTPTEVQAEVPQFGPVWQRGHDDLAALSKHGVDRRLPVAGHYSQLDKPEVVIDAINEVVDYVRLNAIATGGD